MTLTFASTQAKITENYNLRIENQAAEVGIINNANDATIVKVLKNHIRANEITINANNFIMANYITVIN